MDWPNVAEWGADQAHFAEVSARLRDTIRSLDDARLDEELRLEGDTWSVYASLHGAIQHLLYHTGQIVILKKGAPA